MVYHLLKWIKFSVKKKTKNNWPISFRTLMNEILIVPTRTGHNTKKILENGKNFWKSGNFVSPEKWEPWRRSEIKYFHCFHIFRLERSRTWPGLSRGKHLCNEEIRTQCKNTVTVNIIQTTWKDIFVHALDESGNFEVGFGPSQENIYYFQLLRHRDHFDRRWYHSCGLPGHYTLCHADEVRLHDVRRSDVRWLHGTFLLWNRLHHCVLRLWSQLRKFVFIVFIPVIF